jgi:predicted transposase YdaD
LRSPLGSKKLISLAPNNWVRWITQDQDIEVQEFLSSEFQWIGRDNDVHFNILSNALVELRKNEQLEELEPLLSFFASFVLEIPIVQKIMRWNMTVLRESPWSQTILQEGLAKGEQQGIQQGIQRGEFELY